MTTVDSTSFDQEASDESAQSPVGEGLDAALSRLIGWLEVIVDRANPILVKETRQALKSRQFVLTFLVVLIACWIASFAVVAIVPNVHYGAEGGSMLIVYCAILAFPLMLIVPYSAYRSLAAEQEDNTYDLLSITTLTTGQIITGKLGSAAVQMIVYLSAVSPCIAFAFLLRGIDALTVIMLLVYFGLASLGLSMLALLAGTVAKVRYTQVLLSVALIIGLAVAFILSITMVSAFILNSYTFLREPGFWYVNLAFLTLYLTTFALLHAAASAQIAFNSENRSTPLRRIMLVQQGFFLGWIAGIFQTENAIRDTNGGVLVTAVFLGIYWYVMGSMLTSEWPYLSRRVQRSLPQSKMGRMFLTWLNPGPGTGYMFSVANLTLIAIVGSVLLWLFSTVARPNPSWDQVQRFLIFGWCYVVTFLGIGRLLISFARRFIFVSMTAGFLLHMILLLVACGVPQVLSFASLSGQNYVQYSLLHASNPIWTLYVLLDEGSSSIEAFTLSFILIPTALIVLLLNMRTVTAEMRYQRSLLPTRVLEEEAELHPEPEPKPVNPWDE